MYKPFLVCLPLLMICFTGLCQDQYIAGTLTQANVNFKVLKNWKLNTKLESRQIFSEKEPGLPATHRFRYERADLTMVLTTKISVDNTIGGGYLVRLEDNKFTHRLIQQFNNVRSFEWINVAHRIVTDETFSSSEPVDFRLRYRLGLEKPLNGRNIDPKEFYAKVNNEYLGIWSDSKADLEIRGLFAIGYNATDDNKVELGVEYRVNDFKEPVRAQQFWMTVGWFISI
jgi:hypothetical protein